MALHFGISRTSIIASKLIEMSNRLAVCAAFVGQVGAICWHTTTEKLMFNIESMVRRCSAAGAAAVGPDGAVLLVHHDALLEPRHRGSRQDAPARADRHQVPLLHLLCDATAQWLPSACLLQVETTPRPRAWGLHESIWYRDVSHLLQHQRGLFSKEETEQPECTGSHFLTVQNLLKIAC